MPDHIRGVLEIIRFSDGKIGSLSAFCPACDFVHTFNVDLEGHGRWAKHNNPCWGFDGNYDRPTFEGSMLANADGVDEHHPICHSWLKDGVWEYLADCTHDMAGQFVPVPAPDPDMSFARKHGWHLYPYWDAENDRPRK